jgi:hypothetical protein
MSASDRVWWRREKREYEPRILKSEISAVLGRITSWTPRHVCLLICRRRERLPRSERFKYFLFILGEPARTRAIFLKELGR